MIPKPSPYNPLHIYRALLRECTYLPDPAARTYWHSRIVARFREYNPRTNVPWWELPKKTKIKTVDPVSRIKLLHAARKYLSVLVRANLGVDRCLENVLAHTYGRIGKRRHELLAHLEAQSAPVLKDHESVKKLSAALAETQDIDPQSTKGSKTPPTIQPNNPHITTKPTLATFRASPLSPALKALLKAQRAQSLPNDRTAITTFTPQIPDLNSWQRSFPIRRARNIQKRWHKKALDRLLPPLPLYEFERLRDLASGRAKWEGVVPRRRAPTESGGRATELGERDTELGKRGTDPGIQMPNDPRREKTHLPRQEPQQLPRLGTTLPGQRNPQDPHHLTPRLMRRFWNRLLLQCSTMHFDALSGKWKVRWGRDVREEGMRHGLGLDGAGWMFEGCDEGGRVARGGG
ncbi:hypothetical protein MMC30_002911 [Trapelia coarctata]|nr:hypothetical protein [Trapelia coarctata]